ncbi:MAG TPA: hypothetical protein VNJ71_09510 [Gemmatimonadales bacterium]|nr:hypothetical protein [Gemmatimonadales bacterium]
MLWSGPRGGDLAALAEALDGLSREGVRAAIDDLASEGALTPPVTRASLIGQTALPSARIATGHSHPAAGHAQDTHAQPCERGHTQEVLRALQRLEAWRTCDR